MSKLVVSQIEDAGGSSLLGRRNAIINGNFGINQRGVSGTVTLASGVYGHDRWKAGASGCTYTFATSENVTTITISAGSLIQVIEGLNLLSGTHVLSWTGTAQGKIGAGSFGSSGITGSVTGGTNLNIELGTGTVSKVQLEAGDTATPFEHRSFGQELALCQRYFQITDALFLTGTTGASSVGTLQFRSQMRASPTVSLTAPFKITDTFVDDYMQSSANVSIALGRITNSGALLSFGNFSSLTVGRPYMSLPNETGLITLSAEL